MPQPGEYDPMTGAIWSGTAWVGGKGSITQPIVQTTGPNAGQVTSVQSPFPGGTLQATGSDGTQGWYDPATKRVRYYRNGQEIGASAPGTMTGATTSPTGSSTTTPANPNPAAQTVAPTARSGTNLTAAQQDYYLGVSRAALQRLGIIGSVAGESDDIEADRLISDAELMRFASQDGGKMVMTTEELSMYFSSRPDLIAERPWLAFQMGEQEYTQATEGYKAAERATFGKEGVTGNPATGTADERRNSLQGFALQNRVTPEQFGQDLENFRIRTGRAPTSSKEYATFRAQPQTRSSSAQVRPFFNYRQSGAPRLPGSSGQRPAVPK